MTISVQWDNPEQTTVRWDFKGKWDWEMFGEATKVSNTLIESVPHRVDIIGDVCQSPFLPKNALIKYNVFQHNRPQNKGRIVLVGASNFVRNLVVIFSKLYKFNADGFDFTDTLEEARTMLDERREQVHFPL